MTIICERAVCSDEDGCVGVGSTSSLLYSSGAGNDSFGALASSEEEV